MITLENTYLYKVVVGEMAMVSVEFISGCYIDPSTAQFSLDHRKACLVRCCDMFKVLKHLKDEGVKATFKCVGKTPYPVQFPDDEVKEGDEFPLAL